MITNEQKENSMEDKIFNHSIKSDDTAKDLAFVICDIYANEEKEQRALDTILNLCKQIIKK